MNYDQPLKNVSFDRFDPDRLEEYKEHLKPENALVFRNSADLFDEIEQWLAGEYHGGDLVATRGNDPVADAVVVLPKDSGEINRDFSKDVHESKLAKMKSKLGPQ